MEKHLSDLPKHKKVQNHALRRKKNKTYNYTMNSYESNEPVILQKTELERDPVNQKLNIITRNNVI